MEQRKIGGPRLPVLPGAIPWWDGLPDAYRAWQQRDWWADLPWLFLDGPEAHRIRLAAQRTIHRQFVADRPDAPALRRLALEHLVALGGRRAVCGTRSPRC